MLLVTFGVANLCAKIVPHPYFTGLEALNNWLEKFNKEHVKNVRKLFCKTIMEFDNEFFNQIKGTSMGAIFEPTYGTLSMRYSGIKLNNNLPD